jgi:hypothetical protein
MRVSFKIILPALAALAVAGCGRNTQVPRTWQGTTSMEPTAGLPEQTTLVVPEERLTFAISALGFAAGELVMAAGKPGEVDGKRVVYFRSRSVSKGVVALLKTVVDDVTTYIDLDSGTTIYHRTDTKKGAKDTEAVEIHFAPGQFEVAEWDNGDKKVETQVLPEGARGYDMTTALMAMRGWDADKGDRASMFVLRSSLFWQVHLEFAGQDSIRTKLGRFAAVRIDGVSQRYHRDGTREEEKEPRYFSIWLTDDDQRLPLLIAAKTDYGDVRMELIEYVGAGREVAINR